MTIWPRSQLPVVKVREVWAPVMPALVSTVTSALLLAMITVTSSEGRTDRVTVYSVLSPSARVRDSGAKRSTGAGPTVSTGDMA